MEDIVEKAILSQKKEIELLEVSRKESISDTKTAEKENKSTIYWPRPIADEAFYGIAGEVVKTIEPHTEADPVALLANFLTAFGNVVGSQPHLRVEGDNHPLRLFTVLVGETSKARKGTSWGHIRNLFRSVDENWCKNRIETGLSSGEGLIWAVRDKIESGDGVTDEGENDKRLLVVEPELSATLRVLGREGNTLSAIVRSSWDTGDLQILTKNNKAKSTSAHISILAHITKGELLKYLSSTERANGFGNRFLWFCVKRSKTLPFGGELYKVNLSPLINKIIASFKFSTSVGEIKWADETRPLWASIYPTLSQGKPSLFGSMTSRAEANVIRLSCIYALLDSSGLIRPNHLMAALAVWDFVKESSSYIFQDLTGNELADDIFHLLSTNSDGLSRTDLNNQFARHKSSLEISEALSTLIGLGVIESEKINTEGRDKEMWFLTRKKRNSDEPQNHISLFSLNSQVNQDFSYLELLKKLNFKKNNSIGGIPPVTNL